MTRARKFFWLAARSTLAPGRRGRTLTALVAIVTAAALATAVMNLSRDVQAKVRGELRGFGANVVLIAPEGKSLPANSLGLVDSLLKDRGLAVPFAYAIARTSDDAPVVVAGTDFERVHKLNSWWQVSAWPAKPNAALIGARVPSTTAPRSEPFDLNFQRRVVRFSPTGTLRTGGPEDARVYLQLADFIAWTGVQPSVIEISANLSGQDLTAFERELGGIFPAQVREVRQITEAEAKVFGQTRSALLVSVVLIVLTAGLCVLANLTSSVLDRRKDFAIMKALGASELTANAIFALEAALLGTAGAVFGYLIGVGIAAWIGRASLHQAVLPRLDVLPAIVAGSILLTLAAGIFPIRLLRRIQPAAILKGE